MKRGAWIVLCAFLAGAGSLLLIGLRTPVEEQAPTALVLRDSFTVWSSYEGVVEASDVHVIASPFSGEASVTELLPEGSRVTNGTVVLRFDDAEARRELLRLERDVAIARAEFETLDAAIHPLAIAELESARALAQADVDAEREFLEEERELLAEGLVSAVAVERQTQKVAALTSALKRHDVRILLTRQHVHPAELRSARAQRDAKEEELRLARAQLAGCVIRAPRAGTLVHTPLHIRGQYRAVRVGDVVHKNQALMALPDMRSLRVRCMVPEAELSRVAEGLYAEVTPHAYPEERIDAQVTMLAAMAQTAVGKPHWQKYFRVAISTDDASDLMRPGMSVRVRIRSYHVPEATCVPRAAIEWGADTASCRVVTPSGVERRMLVLGRADAQRFEVVSGVKPGDRVVLPGAGG